MQMLLNLIFVTDKESLLSAITESRRWIRENSKSGFVIMLQIETRQFYINISTVHFGSSLDVFIHNYGFSKNVHLYRQLVYLFPCWNSIS